MDVSQYLEIFLDESSEHLQSLNTQILELEQNPENMDTINEIFRAAHSLKGMAGTMGYKRMQALTHDMENVFSEVRGGNIKVAPNMVDILFQCLDALQEYVDNIRETGDEGTNENEHIIKMLGEVLKPTEQPEPEPTAPVSASAPAPGTKGWLDIKLTDSVVKVIHEARMSGRNVYGLTVRVQEACLLKAARAFLVFKAIEPIAEIIVSEPSSQEIEDEHFDLEFSMIAVSESPAETISAAVLNVSEIESCQIEPLDLSLMRNTEDLYRENVEKPASKPQQDPAAAQQNSPAAAGPADHQVAEAAPSKPAETHPESGTGSAAQHTGKSIVNRTVRVDIEKLDVLMNLVSELIIAKNSLASAAAVDHVSSDVTEQIEYLESTTTSLHESVMKVRMVPIENVVSRFPRMVRDLSKKLDKEMELHMSGEETELDRTVVDEIGDPLMHLIRNSADHGLEDAATRLERGKPEVGNIWLDAYQDGNNVVIEVRDDGDGINVDAVRKKAVERGIVPEDKISSMTEKEIIDLLFLPSFSTSEVVTDVSGRGVGLDVVRSKIQSLSGDVEVKTKRGEGSTFTIRLPLTLAIIQALMVRLGGDEYAVPLGSITTIEDVEPSDVRLVQNEEVITLRGNVIPLVRLCNVLDLESQTNPDDSLTVIIAKKGDKLAGLVVDELIGQLEIVIKSMGKYMDNRCKLISGATILGDGEVALILDVNSLI